MYGVDITKLSVEVVIMDDLPVPLHLIDGKAELEPVVDRDLDKFAEFYASVLGNGALSKFERAAIKTYIHWKTHPEKK